MRPEKQQKLEEHLNAIAKLLYEEADSEKVQTLEGIEETIREQTLKYITPQLGFFLSKKRQIRKPEE